MFISFGKKNFKPMSTDTDIFKSYVYSFFLLFQALRLFPSMRLFRTLEYLRMFAKVHSFLNNIVVPSAKVSLRNESFFIIPHHVFQLTLFYQQKSFSDIGSNKNKAFIVYSTYLWPSKEFENVKRLSVHKKSHVFLWKLLLQGNSSCCYASYIKHFEDKYVIHSSYKWVCFCYA